MEVDHNEMVPPHGQSRQVKKVIEHLERVESKRKLRTHNHCHQEYVSIIVLRNSNSLTQQKPRQAAWYEEKISQTQTFESLEPNAEELTKDEMVRKNAFEEFRKQMGKSSNDDNFESSGTGLPSFFGDAPVTDDGLLETLPNDESNFSSMLPNHETNKNYPHSFLGFTTSEVAPSIDSLLNIGGEEDHEEMFAFPFRSKPTESRGASKFFSGLNNAPVEREKNNHALPLQENNLLKKEIEVFDESTFMKEILDHPEKESTKSPVDPLHAIFANSSASSTNSSQTSVANRQINQDKSFPYRQQSTTQNSRVPLEMTDVSSIEQELLKGRGSEPSPTADSATGNFMQDIFQKFQQPQFDAMRMQQHNGPPHQFSQSPTPQSQYINPYEQYRQSQFLKQQQQQQQQQHTQNQAPQVLEETKNTTQPKSAKKGRANQFVPPQISKSIGKAIKPKKQATPNKQASEQVATEHPAQPTQQQQQMPQNFSAQKMLPPHNGMPMNPNYMMQPMHMPTMYNNGNFPQQWFNYVGQQNIPSQTRMMSLPSDALSAEDLERNFMQSRN